MSEARTDGSRLARRVVFGLGEAMAWAALIVLSLISLNGVALVLGLMMLILPGLLLLLFPNLLMVLVLIQPARWVWGWSRILALPTAALGLSVLGIIPMISNARLDQAVVAEQAGDFDRATPAPVRSILLLGGYGLECDQTCRRLLDAGVPIVAVGLLPRSREDSRRDGRDVDLSGGFEGPTARYSLGDERDCKGCILRTDGPGGQADLILNTVRRVRGPERGGTGAAVRYDPFDRGAFVVSRTEAWSCAGVVCRRTLRSTQVDYEPLWPVLVLGIDSASYELYMWRGWQRQPRTAGETDLVILAGRLAAVTPPAEPTNRTVRASLEGMKRELAAAAAEHRAPVVPALGEALQALAGPEDALTDDQLAFLRMLVRHPTLEQIPFNWTRHPEAALKLAPDLGRALERSGDRSNFGRSVQGALATLPEEAFVRQKASILRWLRDAPYGDRFERDASPEFILKLSALGPDFARVAAARAGERGWPESAAMSGALCRLGPEGRPALAALKDRQAEIADRHYQRDGALDRAIAAIEGGASTPEDCYRGRRG